MSRTRTPSGPTVSLFPFLAVLLCTMGALLVVLVIFSRSAKQAGMAAAEEARRLIGGLRPPALDELGIEDAVESLIADARIEIPHVAFSSTIGTARLAPHLETAIFRIVQESLSNVRRHAGATHVSVALDRLPRAIHIHIIDDGCGFDATAVPEERFGLEGIRQRALLLGGHASIVSAPGAGTTVDAELPLPA